MSDTPLINYRVRFRTRRNKGLVSETVKAISVDAALEWAEEKYSEDSEMEIYDVGPIIAQVGQGHP